MRHLTKNHHPTQITLILLRGRVCSWIVQKAWVCKVDAFLFKTHEQNCSRIHESLGVCERATAATVNVLQPLGDERFTAFREWMQHWKWCPFPAKKFFLSSNYSLSARIFCSRSLKDLKKPCHFHSTFAPMGKDVSFSLWPCIKVEGLEMILIPLKIKRETSPPKCFFCQAKLLKGLWGKKLKT